MERESDEMLRRIEAASTNRDLDALVALGQELELIWRDRNAALYGQFIVMLCRALASYGLGDVYRQHRLFARFALEAAETPGALGLDARAQLLQLLPVPVAMGDLAEYWADQRARAARLWIGTWLELERGIDPQFVIEDAPSLSIAPPPGVDADTGIAPEEIADPEQRAQYEALRGEATELARRFGEQVRLRRTMTPFRRAMTGFLAHAYALPPGETDELKALLAEHAVEDTLAAGILQELDRVRNR
jgi:hypothetical protein